MRSTLQSLTRSFGGCIQRNMTEADLAQKLVEKGVPKEDIVLGLHPHYKRPLTGYGVA